MKAFKNILLYIMSILFLLSLTASFEGESIINNNVTGLNLSNEQMKQAFYDPSNSGQDPQETPRETGKQYAMGDTGESILYYQRVLKILGYLDKDADGIFDATTKEAVVAYQKEQNLESNGTLDTKTLDALDREDPAYDVGQEGDEVLHFQEILYYTDYLKVKPQGIFDEETKNALMDYQKAKGLKESGRLDVETMDKLDGEVLTYTMGKEGEAIRLLQEKLIYLEYLTGIADGRFGAMTADGVTRFQKDHELEQTGKLDPKTIEVLDQEAGSTP